jgi:multiple sugar transport system permease protein
MNLLKKKHIVSTGRYIMLVAAAIVILFPIYVMIATSLKTRVQTFTMPPVWLFVPTLKNYQAIIFEQNFTRFLVNSVIVATSTAFVTILVGAFAAYALVRFEFMGKRIISTTTLLMRMVPTAVLIIPLFILWNSWGIANSRTGLMFAYVALNLSFTIWVLRSFMMEIPVEIEESAVIDGCSELGVFFRIVLPLTRPGIAVASIFVFRIAWNEFIMSLVLTNRYTRTLPVAISLRMTELGVQWGEITAIAVIVALPAFIFTFFSARSIIRGLTAGAVKG